MSQSSGAPRRRRGRQPRPLRCVVQLRVRHGGKVFSMYSATIDMDPMQAMKLLQETFRDHCKFRRATDDFRWLAADEEQKGKR